MRDDDDLTPDEFRAAMAAGEAVTINPGPRPSLAVAPLAVRSTLGVFVSVSSVAFGAGLVRASDSVQNWSPPVLPATI